MKRVLSEREVERIAARYHIDDQVHFAYAVAAHVLRKAARLSCCKNHPGRIDSAQLRKLAASSSRAARGGK